MAPLPGTRMIPTGWSKAHAAVVSTSMNATAYVHDPDRETAGALDPVTGQRPAPTPYAIAGTAEEPIRCRIQAITTAELTEQGGQISTTRGYLVQLDDPQLDLPDIEQGHVVRVTSAINDPHLVGLDLHVDDIQHGSERFTRDLVTSHNQQPV